MKSIKLGGRYTHQLINGVFLCAGYNTDKNEGRFVEIKQDRLSRIVQTFNLGFMEQSK